MSKDQVPPPPPPVPPPPPGGPKKGGAPKPQDVRRAKVAEARKRAQALAQGPEEKYQEARKEAENALKKILEEKGNYQRVVPAFEGAPAGKSRQQVYESRDDLIKAISDEISAQKKTISRLEEDIELLKRHGNAGAKAITNMEKVLEFQQMVLANLEATKEIRQQKIKTFVKEYETVVKEIEEREQIQRAFLDGLQAALLQKQAKPKIEKGVDPKKHLNNVFAARFKEFAKLANFSFPEQALIRNFYFENGYNHEKDNAFLWTDRELELRLSSDIQLQKVTYFQLKELVGRSLFVDEANPSDIAKPQQTSKLDLSKAKEEVSMGDGHAPQEPSVPKHGEVLFSAGAHAGQAGKSSDIPSGPRAGQADGVPINTTPAQLDDTTIKIISNILSSIHVKSRYENAGVKKNFSLARLELFQNKDRERQIAELQKAVDIAKIMLEQTKEPQLAFQALDNALAKLDKQLAKERGDNKRKLGDSRLEKVHQDLTAEVAKMKQALGIGTDKPPVPKNR